MTGIVIPDITNQLPATSYDLGPVKPWVAAAGSFLGNMFGIRTEYGWRQSDPFPDHPSGHAIDFMCDIPTGNRLADYAVANYQALGIKYIIHNHQVWNPQQGWHPYTSTDNPHTDHVHITFNDSPGSAFNNGTLNGSAFTVPSSLNLSPVGIVADDKCAWSWAGQCLVSKVTVRKTFGVAWIAAGIGIGLVAAVILVYAMKDTGPGAAVSKSVGAVSDAAGKAAIVGAVL